MNSDDEHSSLGSLVALTIIVFGAVLVCPGVLLTFAIECAFGVRLDRAQLWTFGALSSAGILVTFSVHAGSAARGFVRYSLVALATAAFMLLARYGLHSEWPIQMWNALIT